MIGFSDEESADLESRRSLEFDDVSSLQRTGRRAARQSWGPLPVLPGPAAERASASDGRRRCQPA
eukprot:6830583-Prymnesium_polylepis.1